MPTAIRVRGLCKTFTSQSQKDVKVRALDGIDLDVRQGEILGVLGPNGAGKTTFLNTLSTLLLPDAGTIDILGIRSSTKNYSRLRKLLNMSSGYPNFPWSLTVEENLRFYGRLYGFSGAALTNKVDHLIKIFELEQFKRRRFDELSSGTKQRLALSKALINDPQIIFLDEPTVGLDPDVAAKTREIILNILKTRKVTVLLTTHYMHEAEVMCERIAFIKSGRLLKLATPQELKAVHHAKDLEDVFIQLAQTRPEQSGQGTPSFTVSDQLSTVVEPPLTVTGEIKAWFNRCYAFTYRNYLMAVRNVFAFVELLFWPIVSLISIGLLGNYLQLQEKALAFVMTGAITAGVLQVAQLDVSYSLLYEVWSKSVKQTFLTPVGTSENLFGSWVTGIVRGAVIFLVLSLAARWMFGFHFPNFLTTILYLAGICSCALLLGLLVTVLILTYGQKAEITAWMFAYVFMLICGIYYPVETLPVFFQALARIFPVTYFLEFFRQGFGFHTDARYLWLKGMGLIVLYLILGLIMMREAFHRARQKGIIVRLSE
jgi:ABC-type multidrug transport system ATPase subunit/ABC-type multidrug transport system permease subunit